MKGSFGSISVRKASTKDAESIVSVEKETWIDTYPNEQQGVTKEDVSRRFDNFGKKVRNVKKEIANKNNQFFVVKARDQTVGYIHLLETEKYNDLVQIYLIPRVQ